MAQLLEKKLPNIKCMFLFSLPHFSETVLILRTGEDISIIYTGLHVKYSLFLLDFNETKTLTDFKKNPQISNFIKIHPVAAELFHADRQADIMKLKVTLCNFANVSYVIMLTRTPV